ncbi:MAG: CHRD domain-containing protein [Nitrososphaeraceae archaeon]
MVTLSFSLVAIAMSTATMLPSIKFLEPALAQVEQKFTAKLSGQDEVQPTNTKAAGTAEFTPNSNGMIMSYSVDVNNIDKVTMADIHQGKKGENGPVVVTLIRFKTLTPTGPVNGQLAQGDISSSKLEGPLKGKQISDLTKLIEDNDAYVNVHTKQNPNGEIRGQISK